MCTSMSMVATFVNWCVNIISLFFHFLLLFIDTAGDCYCTPIFCDDGQMRCAIVIMCSAVKVKAVFFGGVIIDLTPDVIGKAL